MPDHSRRPRTGFVKQFSSVFGMAVGSKGIYDDVLKTRAQTSHFTAPVVARDYAEIFSSSSSIPFLELDQFDKRDYDSIFDYADVFCAADGASRRRTNDSLHFTALKESQQHVRKHDMSNRKITPERNGDDTDEITGHAKQIDIIVPLKSDISSAATDYLKQCIDWAPVNKYSRNISSGGLETDGFIEIDLRSYGEDESIFFGMGIETDIIISEEPTFEVIAPSDFVLNSSSPISSFKEKASLRSNDNEDQYDISLSHSQDGFKLQSLDKSFVRESATDDSVSTQNLFTDDHGGAYATSKMLVGNISACSSTSTSEKAEDRYCSSQQNVKLQTVDDTNMSILSNYHVTASVVVPQDISESTQSVDFEHNLDKLNASSEADIVSKIIASGNTYCECNDEAFNGRPASDVDLQNQVLDEVTSIDASVDNTKVNNLESQNSKIISPPADQCNLGYVGLALNKSTTLNSDGFKKSTCSGTKHNHLPSSSEDEIDKNSEVAIYLSAVKRAIREAQVWIDIAKESDGVKGFMKPVPAKTFGQVKEVKEVLKLKVNKTTKFFEPGQTTIGNNCSMSATGKYYIDPWPTSSDLKLTPTNTAGEEIAFEGTAFHMSDEQHQNQNEDVAVDNSLEENMEVASTIPYTPCINYSKEKLTVYNNEEDSNSVHEKCDAIVQAMDDFGSVKFQDEGNWCQIPKVGKTDVLVIPPDNYEALSNDYDDTNTVPVINESEIESRETVMVKDQGFIMFSFHNDFVLCQVEVKDLISRTGHVTVYPEKNEAIKTDSECVGTPCSGNSEDDLISLEENATEMELDPHDQASDCEDFQDFASAEENLVSTDTDGINENDLNMSAHVQITEIEDVIMQNIVVPEVTSFTEDVLAACFSNINEEPTVEEILESDAMPFLNNVTQETNVTSEEMAELILVNSTEDPVVAGADESENKQLQKLVTHDVASDALIEPFFKNTNKDTVDKETDVSVDVSMLNMVTPETKNTAEDSIPSCFDCVEEYPSAEDADRAEAVPKKIMVIPEENKISQNNIALSFDNSNADLMAAETETDTARQFAVSSPDQELEKVVGDGTSYILEDTKLEKEKTAGVPDEEYAYSCSDGLEVEQISTRIVTKESIENKMDESRSMPWICDNEIQERDAACVCDLEDREELHDVAIIEALNIEKGHKATNVESFLSDQVSTDAAALEDAIKLKSTPLYPEHDDNNAVEAVIDNCKPPSDNIMTEETVEFELHGENWISKLGDIDLESRIQISATLPDAIKNDETLDFEQQGENLIQLGERHERKKWEITKESYDLPESKVRIFEIQDTMDQEGFELKRQTDKHERKKWEIPGENFELPVLDDARIVEENDEIAGQYKKNDTTFAEKPERKKWKIQNDGYEVPVSCDDAVEYTLGKDESDVMTVTEEELRMADNLPTSQMYNFESSQHFALQNDCFAKEVGCPDREVLSGFCVGNSKEHMKKESFPEIKTLDEEEHEKQFCENPIHQKANVGEGKPGEQGVCAKVLEDINVKYEIKRTLGMFWKKIYKSKLDEDFESVEINTREQEIFGRVVDNDLNLDGPVELVESPRQQDDIEVYDFSGQSSGSKENAKENLYLKQVEVNRSETCTSEELFSTTGLAVEVQENASSASEQCTIREDEKNSWDEGTNIQNCWNNVNDIDMESCSEDVQSSNGSENPTEMKQIHEVFKLQQGKNQKADISLLDASGQPHSEMVSTFKELLPNGSGSLISDPEKSRNVKLEVQEYRSEQDNMLAIEINMSELTGKELLNEGEPSIAEERATEGLHKEVTRNLEMPQNMVSTKERERIEPERVIQEARDRGFSDAKERAATDREKTPASKQEQLQNAPSDAKLDAEENSLDPKRKAELEHAAIERATAEARQHALEKAMPQKFSKKMQEQASQGNSSKFPNSSNYHNGSSSEDKLNDDSSSEPLVRFKAINERGQRIAERAAKAFEEKNLRDLHVLREQAERNRLAKTLDVEIDLWANCKTGNLRALLSTLQYVLGPDSGWQPIQLTDIVATDAVKKAYRKATLFVHPDKLQQRGATIKQKYICEKVFDLLKEAWNRFDRDEH